ncbi:MAG: TRAP transporter small permease [Rhodospirillales bacterium]|nr:TRAP transporter small permease [Rhodospirillales bacterium]
MDRKPEQRPPSAEDAAPAIPDPDQSQPEPPERLPPLPKGALAEKLRWVIATEAIVERILYVSIVGFGLCLAGLMFTQVVLRYAFASPFVGIEELSLLFGAWFYFLGIAYVTRDGEHIHGGILTMVVRGPTGVQAVRLIVTVLGVGACAVFGYFAIKYALFEIQTGRLSSYMRWPKGLWSASLIFGFVGTTIYMVLQALHQFLDLQARLRTRTRR